MSRRVRVRSNTIKNVESSGPCEYRARPLTSACAQTLRPHCKMDRRVSPPDLVCRRQLLRLAAQLFFAANSLFVSPPALCRHQLLLPRQLFVAASSSSPPAPYCRSASIDTLCEDAHAASSLSFRPCRRLLAWVLHRFCMGFAWVLGHVNYVTCKPPTLFPRLGDSPVDYIA